MQKCRIIKVEDAIPPSDGASIYVCIRLKNLVVLVLHVLAIEIIYIFLLKYQVVAESESTD